MRGAGSRGRLPLAVVLCVLSLGGRGKRRAPSALAHYAPRRRRQRRRRQAGEGRTRARRLRGAGARVRA